MGYVTRSSAVAERSRMLLVIEYFAKTLKITQGVKVIRNDGVW